MEGEKTEIPKDSTRRDEADSKGKHFVYFESEPSSASTELTRLIDKTYREQGGVLGVLVTNGTEMKILFSSEAPHHPALEMTPRGIGFDRGATFEYCNTPDISNILVIYGYTERETEPLALLKFIVNSWPLTVTDTHIDASIDNQGLKSLARGNIAAISRFLKRLDG